MKRMKLLAAMALMVLGVGCTAYPPSVRYGMYNSAYQGGGASISGYGAGGPSYQGYGGASGYGAGGYGNYRSHGPKYGTMSYSPGVTKYQEIRCHGAPEVESSKAYMFMGMLVRVNTTKVDRGCDVYTEVHSQTPTIIYRKSLP